MALLNPGSEAFQPRQMPLCADLSPIAEVWRHNFREEILHISMLVDRYNIVAMDTEFPGILYRLEGDCPDSLYQTVRVNVNATKLIQIGISLADEDGCVPPGTNTWQFNLHFDTSVDCYSQDSIDLLTRAGLHFSNHARYGIDPLVFAEMIMVSGLVLNDRVKWVTFHGGFDFGYFLRTLTARSLPDTETAFLQDLRLYFPTFYDLKYFIRQEDRLKGSLSRLAEQLNITRIGTAHQAGSDAIVTLACFFELQKGYFEETVPDDYDCVLFGMGSGRAQWSTSVVQEAWRPQGHAQVEVSISN